MNFLTHTPANESPVMGFMTRCLTNEGPAPRVPKSRGEPALVHFMFEGGPADSFDDVLDTGLTAGSKWFSKKNSDARRAHLAQPGVRAAWVPPCDR